MHAFFRWFNWSFDKLSAGYSWLVGRTVRIAALMLLAMSASLAFGLNEFRKTPVGFIPQQDAGYLITISQLPPAASLARTDAVNRRAVELALEVPGVAHAVNLVGFSGATRTNASNAGAVFVTLKPFEERAKDPRSRLRRSRRRCSASSRPSRRPSCSWWRRRRSEASAVRAVSA